MFTITTEPAHKLVRVTISGILSVADVEDLFRKVHEEVRAMRCRIGSHLVLADFSASPIQFQDAVAALQSHINSAVQAKRLAMVTGDSPARMQVRRLIARDEAELFGAVGEAEAWLFGAQGAEQPA